MGCSRLGKALSSATQREQLKKIQKERIQELVKVLTVKISIFHISRNQLDQV